MTIIENLKVFFESCPLIQKTLNVDFLSDEPIEYSIYSVPCKPILKSYVDGSVKKQYHFILASREYYGDDVSRLIENIEFYEMLSSWIDEKNKCNELPSLSENQTAIKIEVLNSGYLSNEEKDNAQYQIECRLIYFEGEETHD